MKRRAALHHLAVLPAIPMLPSVHLQEEARSERAYKHSVCRWCYKDYTLDQLCEVAKECGIQSVELLDPADWDTVLSRGLEVALSNGSRLGISKGFNDHRNHGQLRLDLMDIIPMAAEKGIPQVIVFSGNRNNMPDDQGLENCAVGLEPVVRLAARYGIQIVMELLNSKVDHHDYQCDHTEWGVALVDKIGSSHFKLLYDIYHMQIMEGDVIRTITRYKDYIGHYHTAGVPGRHEIDDTQELFYPAIMRAIAATGFNGYVAQEFIPRSTDVVQSLKEGIRLCSV